MRERVTISIRDDLLKQVDRLVDGLTIRSRSQAIEFLLLKFLTDFRLKTALVLAGGKGKGGKNRFIQKINGKTLLQHVLDKLSQFNIGKFFVYVDFEQEKIKNSLKEKKLDYSVKFLESVKPLGTIEPLLKIKGEVNDTFLLAYGDTICSLNINEMLSFHKKNKSLVTVALTTVSNPKKYGVAVLEGNKIKKFEEKPKTKAESFLINAGYYLIEPEIFKHISRKEQSLESELLPKLASKGLLFGYPFQGLYLNINSQEDLEKAKKLL
jgi:NDP-sugar pyrophosphorylase family protein